MKQFTILLIHFLIFCLSCAKPSASSGPERSFAVIADGVRLRAEPKTTAAIVTYLNTGDEVFVDNVLEQAETIDGRTGKWHHVVFGCPNAGWVFGPFLKEGGETANALYTVAGKMEKNQPDKAIGEYQRILGKFPKATLFYGCHGSWPFKKEVEQRISAIQCELKAPKGLGTFEAASDRLIKELQTANPNLADLVSCEIRIEIGPIDLPQPASQGIAQMLEYLKQSPPVFAAKRVHENRVLLIPHPKAQNNGAVAGKVPELDHQFYFENTPKGWFLRKYCFNCMGIYPADQM